MKLFTISILATVIAFTFAATAQKKKARGLRQQAQSRENYRVTVVEIPKEVASHFLRLEPKVLLYQPVKTTKEKTPLVVTLSLIHI